MMVRTGDWSKCRYEQGHLYRFPAQSVSPQKMLASVNFEIMPCIEYQSVVTFLYCQMLPKQLNGYHDLWTTGMLLSRNEYATSCLQYYVSFGLCSDELNWVVAPVWVGPLKHHSKFYDDCKKKMVCEMHCFLCGEQCLFKSL